jgi:hypothetical protein
MKSQIPGSKSQTNLNSQVPKYLNRAVFLPAEYWSLKFPWTLGFGDWNFYNDTRYPSA